MRPYFGQTDNSRSWPGVSHFCSRIIVGFIVNINCTPDILGGVENMEKRRALVPKYEELAVSYFEVPVRFFSIERDRLLEQVVVIFLDLITVGIEDYVFKEMSIIDEYFFFMNVRGDLVVVFCLVSVNAL